MSISYVNMCADILHHGHINVLKTASLYGNVLVGLMTDDVMEEYKRKPFISYENRRVVLESIKYVSHVVPQKTMSMKENLTIYKPDFLVHADDWKTSEKWLKYRQEMIVLLNQWGGKFIEVKYTEGISTTAIADSIGNRIQKIQASS